MRVRLAIFGALSAGAMAYAARLGPAAWGALFAAGLALWTIIEYLLHRLAFHGFAPHYQHHETPTDPVYIVAPLWLSAAATLLLFPLFSLAAHSWRAGAAVLAGVLAGYLAYEAIHLRIHQAAPGGALLRALRRHHYYHHFANDHACYGVTSPVWDWVFGSVPPTYIRRTPRD